jgi:hypothetical protein
MGDTGWLDWAWREKATARHAKATDRERIIWFLIQLGEVPGEQFPGERFVSEILLPAFDPRQ